MPFKTYTMKLGERTLSIQKLSKEDAQRVGRAIQNVNQLAQHRRELRNHLNDEGTAMVDDDHGSSYFVIFGGGCALAPEVIEERTKFLATIPDVITPENREKITSDCAAFVTKHMPVDDKRHTLEEALAQKKNDEEYAAKEKAKREAFEAGSVEIPSGACGIILALCEDQSDMMSDYYAPHCSVDTKLLAIIRKQAETQSLARSVIALAPELEGVEFEWRTEKYSMGHGNYLMQKGGTFPEKGEKFPRHWEIQFTYRNRVVPHANFGKAIQGAPAPAGVSGPVEVTRNEGRDGIEIRFSAKPGEDVRAEMKGQGFRWSGRQGLWYSHFSVGKLEFAESLKARVAK